MVYQTVIINIPEILKKCGLKPGQTVVDLGTGREGRFALAAGKVIGDYGKVWAVDISKEILPAIDTKATMLGINNVKTLWADLELENSTQNHIPDGTVDLVILATVLYQSKKQPEILKEAVRMLKDGGKLVIVEWIPENTPIGPPLKLRVHPDVVKQVVNKMKLMLLEEFPAGQYHYGMIFQK